MKPNGRKPLPRDHDALRLFALGRIPRCARCPRYQGLKAQAPGTPLADVPSNCSYQVCAPLVVRHEKVPRPRLVVALGGGGY